MLDEIHTEYKRAPISLPAVAQNFDGKKSAKFTRFSLSLYSKRLHNFLSLTQLFSAQISQDTTSHQGNTKGGAVIHI